MKKTLFTIGLFVLSMGSFAQIPDGYYNTATADGFILKTQLKNIISGHNDRGYGALWDLYKKNNPKNGFKDIYYEKDNTLLDIYSESPTASDPYNYIPGSGQCGNYAKEGDCYNREHLIPQSYFNKATPMVSDAFHIWPTDGYVNSRRANYPFGVVANAVWTSKNGTKLGNNLNAGYSAGYSKTVVEPIDEFKGDIARVFFYFVTRYEDRMPSFYSSNSEVRAMFDGTANKAFSETFLKILYTWHIMDPVSERERNINDLIYYTHQNNRNPFIDHPEFVNKIWKMDMSIDNFDYQERKDIIVYTSANNTVSVRLENSNKNIARLTLYNLQGQIVAQKENLRKEKTVELRSKQSGVYILKVEGKGLEINKKVILK
ncbi:MULTISPECIES: endonuclease [Weeksella]|uniref:endonuclease n=1 Tax=Weeksella TaxID=1013 RepID=UPI0008A2A746|nr:MULTISPECIES: endonuclease [Weeksella]MDK7375482.1 endonuclease [Weeksella virosa]OFM84537.1 endonuclease I [Weeksella sp. HMSC059D05]